MGKPNFQSTTISRVIAAAPELKYIAFYHAGETPIKSCMTGYKDRSLVYILTVKYADSEVYLYAGKSHSQYSRFLMHLKNYAFDDIFLFECTAEHLSASEAAVIRELKPLLNRNHNPEAEHNKQFLGICFDGPQDAERIQRYLDMQERYAPVGLYGFSLPPAVFSVVEKKAGELGCTCSELLQRILEQTYKEEIADELCDTKDWIHTNLVTAKTYGALHKRSREQIKQYLNQGNRVLGTAKIGRDWVILDEAKFPKDLRRKLQK